MAIVAAYDNPNAEGDLATYRAAFGLPPCTTAGGCFRKADQDGNAAYPKPNASWAQESALDLAMVSASCPNCRILLIEASSASLRNLGAAVNTAARLGANAISNSYGAPESSRQARYDTDYYDHPGVAITASSGDSGYGPQYPASSPYVTAVGGTTLMRDTTTTRGWVEVAWAGAGSGCSDYAPKPAWQTDTGCPRRTVADVSAVADPATGVAVYHTPPTGGTGSWRVMGGTSVAAPIIAGVYALASDAGGASYGSRLYSQAGVLNDVTVGGNGACGGTYLCAAGPGYDGPSGLGTPQGIGGF